MKPLVLVVDDEKALCRIVERALDSAGFDVASAHDAGEAWSILETTGCTVCVTDYSMPGESGLVLVRKIRADARFARLPLIVHSGSLDRDAEIEFLRLGALAVLEKPVPMEDLVAAVRRALPKS